MLPPFLCLWSIPRSLFQGSHSSPISSHSNSFLLPAPFTVSSSGLDITPSEELEKFARCWIGVVPGAGGGQKPSEDAGQQCCAILPKQLFVGTHSHDKRCCWWQQLQVPDLSKRCGAHPLSSFPHPQPFLGLHSPWHDASELAALHTGGTAASPAPVA